MGSSGSNCNYAWNYPKIRQLGEQLMKIAIALRMMEEFGSSRNRLFDFIIKLRPDLLFETPISLMPRFYPERPIMCAMGPGIHGFGDFVFMADRALAPILAN